MLQPYTLTELVVEAAVERSVVGSTSDADAVAVALPVDVGNAVSEVVDAVALSKVTTVTYGTKAVCVVVKFTGSAVMPLPLTDSVVDRGMSVETSTMFVTGICVKNVMTPGDAGSVKLTRPVGTGKNGSLPLNGLVELSVKAGGETDTVLVGAKEPVEKSLNDDEGRVSDVAVSVASTEDDTSLPPMNGALTYGLAAPDE